MRAGSRVVIVSPDSSSATSSDAGDRPRRLDVERARRDADAYGRVEPADERGGVSSSRILPASMIATRSHSASASSM